jgi:hypothetical protein
MKFAFPTAVLVAFLGIGAPTHAGEERGQGGHPQGARPAQQQARPTQQQARPAQQRQQFQQQARPAQQRPQPQQQARPAARHPTQTAMPAQQQRVQPVTRSPQQQVQPVNRAQRNNAGLNQVRAQQSPPASPMRGGYEHGRISDDHYATHFGSRHSFHVSRGDYDHRRFWYGGYQFGFIDPWPIGWGYSDDVYVEYDDGGYYMYDRFRPGVRISINIL